MIRILLTGGTFDKEYDEITGRLYFKETHLPEMLRLGRCRVPVTLETVMLIDSLQMTDDGRRHIVARCRACDETQIVVTHGTDTMVETAAVLASADLGKTVVLTGATIPYAFGSSDGLFNLGSALSFVTGSASWRVSGDERDALHLGQRAEEPRKRDLREESVGVRGKGQGKRGKGQGVRGKGGDDSHYA